MDSAIFSYFIFYPESTLVIAMQIILSDACNHLKLVKILTVFPVIHVLLIASYVSNLSLYQADQILSWRTFQGGFGQ